MAPSSDLLDRETIEKRRNRGPPFILLLPLIYAPILPLIRIGLRRKPVLRDRLFFGVLAGAFAHGTYLVSSIDEDLNLSCLILIEDNEWSSNFLHAFIDDNDRTDLYDVESK